MTVYQRHSALFRNLLGLALTAVAFFLFQSEFATGLAPEFHVSTFWLTTAILSIYLCACAFLLTVYRIFRDLFFAVLTWYYTRRERKSCNV